MSYKDLYRRHNRASIGYAELRQFPFHSSSRRRTYPSMAINLEAFSHKELEDLINSAESHIKASRAENIKAVRGKIEALLTANGFNLVDVFPTHGNKGGSKGVVAPKYRNPSNVAQTWSGRGNRPLWFVEALKARGATMESFLIAPPSKIAAPVKSAKVTKAAVKKAAPKKAVNKAVRK
jgi:DNA-binding protein H-NS